jgi:hypothetical protein
MALSNAERQAAFRERGADARRTLVGMMDGLREGIAIAAAVGLQAELDGHEDTARANRLAMAKLWEAYDMAVRAL